MAARVLIVDDEAETTELVKMSLEMSGFTCWAAKESDGALKCMTGDQPNLVFLDKKLDGSRLDGFGILEEANKLPNRSSMKIYIVTGYPDPETEARAKELKADGYLIKPLTVETLLKIAKSIP